MSADSGLLIMRPGVHPRQVVGKKIPPPPEFSDRCEDGLRIERNVAVPLRDGVRILIDIYTPQLASQPLPLLLGWSPYGKHNVSDRLPWPAADVASGWISRHTAFEAPDPLYWCRNGYAVVYPDPRGSWYSEGELRHGGIGEAEDCHDLIEWLGRRPWSNGRIGMTSALMLPTSPRSVKEMRRRSPRLGRYLRRPRAQALAGCNPP